MDKKYSARVFKGRVNLKVVGALFRRVFFLEGHVAFHFPFGYGADTKLWHPI
jgi:hypothetical protein